MIYSYAYVMICMLFVVVCVELSLVGAGGQVSVVQALLEELPGQFLSYVRCRNINPVGAPAI